MNKYQTLLGAKGPIAKGIAKTLPQYTDKIRLVSRNPEKVNPTDEIFAADITDWNQVKKAVKDSEVVYLSIGLPYRTKIWKKQWPKIMQNVINACKEEQAKLVFFDNLYLYGKVDGWMTEESPVNPASKKGEVRAKITGMIMDEVNKGNLKALIARAPDFYGPDTPLSFVNVMVFENLKKGKKAQLMISKKPVHSYIYTPDASKATALLANTESAYNQVWHLPTDKQLFTGEELVKMVAEAFNAKAGITVLQKWMVSMFGMINKDVGEAVEMLYQNKYDYMFDSSKFAKAFDFTPTSYQEGIKQTVEYYLDQ